MPQRQRLGSVLVISPQRAYLARAAEWVRRLDTQAAGAERQFYTYAAWKVPPCGAIIREALLCFHS